MSHEGRRVPVDASRCFVTVLIRFPVLLMHLIIGQGLAGTAMAWRLWERGAPFLLVDRDEPTTSSKIAAGLLTPVTGMRLSLSENYGPWLREAVKFYRHKQRLLDRKFLHAQPHVRLFKTEEERQRWTKRQMEPGIQPFLGPLKPLNEHVFSNPLGGFQMKHAGWLDTAAYLAASRDFFLGKGCWEQAEFRCQDLIIRKDEVKWAGRAFGHAILCTGWEAMKSPWFDWVPFQPARGTILTAALDLQGERRILHHHCWVLPRPDGTAKIGATYEMRFDDPHGQDERKLTELHGKLQQALRVPVDVLKHEAAVRPIIAQQRTLIGPHPAHSRLMFFNGLGSKGVLRSPAFASMLTSYLIDAEPIPNGVHVAGNL